MKNYPDNAPSGPSRPMVSGIRRALKVLLFAVPLVVAVVSVWGRLPAPYEEHGTIRSVDKVRQIIVLDRPPRKLLIGKAVKPAEYVWTEETQFLKDGQLTNATPLLPGERASVWYRYSTNGQPPWLVKVSWPDRK